jgi:restriction system protein
VDKDWNYKRGETQLPKLITHFDRERCVFDNISYLKSVGANKSGKKIDPQVEMLAKIALSLSTEYPVKPGIYDWVVKDTYGWMVDGERSAKKFATLQAKDIKAGNLNHAIRRSVAFILFAVLSTDTERFGKTPMDCNVLVLCMDQTERFTEGTFKACVESLFGLLTSIKACKLISQIFIDSNIDLPTTSLAEIGSLLLSEGYISEATDFFERLQENDQASPLTSKFEEELNRHKRLQSLSASGVPTPSDLQNLSGVEFEKLIAQKFLSLGYKCRETPTTGDYGADLIVETRNEARVIIQCKRYKAKLNLKAVQEVISAMAYYGGDYGIVITTNGYLKSAIELAKSADVELWDGDRLLDFLSGDISFSELSNL